MKRIVRKFPAVFAALSALLLAACAHTGFNTLMPGVTTEAQVQAQFGPPDMSWTDADGSRQLEYSGQPNGFFCHMVFIAPDGKLREVRQTFNEATYARIVPGMTQEAVRRLLGHADTSVRFDLKPDEEVWSWRLEETGEKIVYFNAYFDRAGQVLRSEKLIEYKPSGPGLQ